MVAIVALVGFAFCGNMDPVDSVRDCRYSLVVGLDSDAELASVRLDLGYRGYFGDLAGFESD